MIEQIKNQIRESFKNLYFEEEEHVYTLKGNKLPAVSNCIDNYKREFETDIIAAAYAKKHKRKVVDVIKEWGDKKNAACDKGTKAHNFGEKYFYDKATKIENGYDSGIVKFWKDIPNTIIPLVSETRLYSETYKFAGTPDNLFWCTEREGIIVTDYKTNEDIYKNFRGKKMLTPFDFLLDMPFNHYAIQLSYYRIPLEDLGFNVVGMFLIWLDGKGGYQRIKVPDYSSHLRYYLSDIPNY